MALNKATPVINSFTPPSLTGFATDSHWQTLVLDDIRHYRKLVSWGDRSTKSLRCHGRGKC